MRVSRYKLRLGEKVEPAPELEFARAYAQKLKSAGCLEKGDDGIWKQGRYGMSPLRCTLVENKDYAEKQKKDTLRRNSGKDKG